jgi:SAM-dependent methyltransferase
VTPALVTFGWLLTAAPRAGWGSTFAVMGVFGGGMLLSLLALRALVSTGVPVRACSDASIAAAMELLRLQPGETFVDLGCGDGRVLRAARAAADVQAVGYELNPYAALKSWWRGDRKTRVRMVDFRYAELGQADAAFAYLMPHAMAPLAMQLEAQLKPGARVVVIDFACPDWTPSARRETGPLREPVLLYVMGQQRPPLPATA